MLARDANTWLRKTESPCILTIGSAARVLNKFRRIVRIITRLLTVKTETKSVPNDAMEKNVKEKVMEF
jgi:hypothetical protein